MLHYKVLDQGGYWFGPILFQYQLCKFLYCSNIGFKMLNQSYYLDIGPKLFHYQNSINVPMLDLRVVDQY